MSELIDRSHSIYKLAAFDLAKLVVDISQRNQVAIFTGNHGERL